MRRHDREISDSAFYDHVFKTAEHMVVAMQNNDSIYCLPFNFARDGNRIYIHSAREGTKLDCIRNNGNVSFNLICDTRIIPEEATTRYKSICGQGQAAIISDREEKRSALDLLAKRYGAKCHVPARDSDIDRVAIIRIDITEMTGKQSVG